ncbi:MAG: SRPBCC family protein [Immundisolibacter sp.]|uniref:SRPBCC family protein n=1 Tax=Immundisolibacter sp. TaxID=1934948 RepID=UPI003EE1F06E
MHPITASTWIAAPQSEVFALASDLGNCAEWLSGVTATQLLTPGPVGPGTKFRETRRIGGREEIEEMTVAAFDRPRSYTLTCDSHGVRFTTVLMFESDREGTIVSMDMQTQPTSFSAKLLSLFAGLMAGKMRKCLLRDLGDLKQAAEKAKGAVVH